MTSSNFEDLIIDQSQNRDAYMPSDGVFFWAIDTAQLSVANGNEWHTLSTSGRAGRGPQIAPPNQVQASIDDVATNEKFGTGRTKVVSLDPSMEYNPSTPWEIKRGVILDCNGATIRPSTDTDVLYLYPDAKVQNVRIDVRDVQYTSTVISLDTAFDGTYGPVVNKAVLDGAQIVGSPGTGTGIKIRSGSQGNISRPELYGNIQGFDTAIDISSEDNPSSFANAILFKGVLMNYRLGINQHGIGKANGNHFDVFAQPLEGQTETLWRLDGTAEYNICRAQIWDKQLYTGPIWEITPDTGGDNLLIDMLPFLKESQVKNQSAETNNIRRIHDRWVPSE